MKTLLQLKPWLLLAILLFSVSVGAATPENPFGKDYEGDPYAISWDDGLLQVINKLKALDGVTEIKFSIGRKHEVNVIDVSTQEDLNKKFGELVGKYIKPEHRNPEYVAKKKRSIDGVRKKEYFNKDGKKIPYTVGDGGRIKLIANPVMISGAPFEYNVKFMSSSGLGLVHPEQVVIDEQTGLTLPAITYEARLNAHKDIQINATDDARRAFNKKIQKLEEYHSSKKKKGSEVNDYITMSDGGKRMVISFTKASNRKYIYKDAYKTLKKELKNK